MTRWVKTSVGAQIAGVSIRTIQVWCQDGLIPPAHYRRPAGGQYQLDRDFIVHLARMLKKRKTRSRSAAVARQYEHGETCCDSCPFRKGAVT